MVGSKLYREQWEPVKGYPNYSVSNFGEVVNIKTGHAMTPNPDKNGTLRVNLSAKDIPKTFFIHRLVAQAFLSDWDERYTVRHIGNNQDNSVFNLEMDRTRRAPNN